MILKKSLTFSRGFSFLDVAHLHFLPCLQRFQQVQMLKMFPDLFLVTHTVPTGIAVVSENMPLMLTKYLSSSPECDKRIST